ncbi:hypothetical protein GPX89_09980 [Nocardia sp. ET3-3]|uniref:Uncharacterized protein n=1 Tax=Nocardia terrae TaxID=2675851 RepID=A0A7K1UT92_9NOCA|nr:hypothetical protein [Nocardia terrae]MVU77567.1 hypothetical protein [Nocardia terrae]
MDLRIAVDESGNGMEALHSLFTALVADDRLRAAHKQIVRSTPRPTSADPEPESIRVIADAPDVWGALYTAILAWLPTRRERLRLKFTGPDGVSIRIEATGGPRVEANLVRQAIEVMMGADPDITGKARLQEPGSMTGPAAEDRPRAVPLPTPAPTAPAPAPSPSPKPSRPHLVSAFAAGFGGIFDLFGTSRKPPEPLPSFESTIADDLHELCRLLGTTPDGEGAGRCQNPTTR